jgi:hypothetical protein
LEEYATGLRLAGSLVNQAGQFRFAIPAANGMPRVLESSANLKDWAPVWTNSAPSDFIEPQSVLQNPKRFYRARQ